MLTRAVVFVVSVVLLVQTGFGQPTGSAPVVAGSKPVQNDNGKVLEAHIDNYTEIITPANPSALHASDSPEDVILVADKAELERRVMDAGDKKLVVVDFVGPDCSGCKDIRVKHDEYKKKYPYVEFLEVDVIKSNDIVEHFDVPIVPYTILLMNATQIEAIPYTEEDKLPELIARYSA